MIARIVILFLCGLPNILSLQLSIHNLSKQFPTSLWRTLTSSVPVRQYALKSVSLEADSEFLLLLGASSSGKSTVLQCILGGSMKLSEPTVRPIYLDRKPNVYSQPNKPIGESLLKTNTNRLQHWSKVMELDLSLTFSDLSPSQVYQYALVHACCQSHENSPLLLLDEWMDKETSVVVQKVELSLLRLAEQGAIILCVTHKPEMFAKSHRRITLCRGEILADEPKVF
jgi:ABC-type lipoprotein export system ATPase subunit